MNTRRLLFPDRPAVYHVMNRLVRREFWLDERCREVFVAQLRRQAKFAGIEVLTYCIMGNHFHLLVRVPASPLRAYLAGAAPLSDEAILERYRSYYAGRNPISSFTVAELERRLQMGGDVADKARRRVLARMGDLSVFIQELKHNFTLWFNAKHENDGTIWSAKFKSVALEDSIEVLSTVAAYIDLNPVRASIVDDPATYRWSGYAAAMAGHHPARAGICKILSHDETKPDIALAQYRQLLFSVGLSSKPKMDGTEAGSVNKALSSEILEHKGVVSQAEALRCRWRFLSESRVIGSEPFIESIASELSAVKATTGKRNRRPLPEGLGRGLFAISRRLLGSG